ncbi:hypothetical protein KY290_010852 [Solanum tuberosum]|uniref:Uncharacterized protein n=1 Tax=Solanum tuberosum TaxID=4113 RepID=A0ABQ7W103_SOLTU|nr:hypothetical protein KY290_010852 [Solanum tuberosum]
MNFSVRSKIKSCRRNNVESSTKAADLRMKSVECKGEDDSLLRTIDPTSMQLRNKDKVISEMQIENLQEKTNGIVIGTKEQIIRLSRGGSQVESSSSKQSWQKLSNARSKIKFWGNEVVYYVLGVYPPFQVIQEIGKQEVLQGGIYNFDNMPFIVKEWTPELEFTREEL